MRDPDLVFKAQMAATALERAWRRWRAEHGLDADSLPAVSSYVGYSLEEPWGQPRVVFGLAADDAERLATLLNGHKFAAGTTADGDQARLAAGPLPVPPQAPSIVAEQAGLRRPGSGARRESERQGAERSRPGRRPRPDGGDIARPAVVPGARRRSGADALDVGAAVARPPRDIPDGPVFRQVLAAIEEASARRARSGPPAPGGSAASESAAQVPVPGASDSGAPGQAGADVLAGATPAGDQEPTVRRREDESPNGVGALPDHAADGQRASGADDPRDPAADVLPDRGAEAMPNHPADGTDDRGYLGNGAGQPAADTERTAGSHRAQISEPLVPPGEQGAGPEIGSRPGRHGQPAADDDGDLTPWPEQFPAASAAESGSGRRSRPVLPPVSTTVRRAERRAPRPPVDLPADGDQPAVPGPLTLAASTARMEAETRIRAALSRTRGAGRAGASHQAASGDGARAVSQARAV
ncbi:MAG: hypothetical protein ACYCU3_11080, partial [Streptosporangiaceae bacterium]